jgi:hypothetical protein
VDVTVFGFSTRASGNSSTVIDELLIQVDLIPDTGVSSLLWTISDVSAAPEPGTLLLLSTGLRSHVPEAYTAKE